MASAQFDTFLSSPVSVFARLDVPRIPLTAKLSQVAAEYRNSLVHCVLLTNKEGKLAGLLDGNAISHMSEIKDTDTATAFDLLRLNSRPLVAVNVNGKMDEALSVMNGDSRIDILPVITNDGSPVGVISRTDLAFKSVASGANVPNASVQFSA